MGGPPPPTRAPPPPAGPRDGISHAPCARVARILRPPCAPAPRGPSARSTSFVTRSSRRPHLATFAPVRVACSLRSPHAPDRQRRPRLATLVPPSLRAPLLAASAHVRSHRCAAKTRFWQSFDVSEAVGRRRSERNQAKPLVATSPFRIPCGQDCQNLVFAAHRDAETCAKPCCACWEADYISGKLIVRRRKTPSASREARAGLFASRLRSWKAVCPCALQEAVRSRRVR